MGVFQNNLMGAAAAAAAGGGGTTIYDYQIANSVRLNGSNQYFNRTASSGSTNSDKKAISVWYKRAGTTGNTGATYIMSCQQDRLAALFVNDGDTADNFGYFTDNGGQNGKGKFLQRDFNAWYHLVFLYDATLSTGVDRVKVYINGVHYTTADTTFWNIDNNGYPGQNTQIGFGMQSNENNIGRYQYNGSGYFNGYLADFIMIDGGTVPSISDFGETVNGVWVPKDPSGLTFGTNGFWLKFESGSDLGNDSSGNNNDWTANNFSAHDQMLDSPTFNSSANGGNFMTYNPLNKGSYTDLSEGNLKADSNTGADATYPTCTFGVNSGKWYVEHLMKTVSGNFPQTTLADFGGNSYSTTRGIFYAMRYHPVNGCEQGSGTNVADFGTITVTNTSVATFSSGDIVSWYIDMDNKKAWIAKNGTIPNSGNPANGTNPQFSWTENPINSVTVGSVQYQTSDTILNAGQDGTFAGEKTAQGNSDDTGYGNFYYDPPTGFLALCSGNLPVADAVNPSETDDNFPQKLFDAKLYTGSGGTQTISGVGFQPDFTWIKNRGATADNVLMDSTRGAYASNDYYYQRSNTTALQDHTTDFHNFASDGFIVGGTGTYFNASGNTFASWNWRANGGTTSTNTQGSEDSTVQVDPSGHFSIVKWTGTSDSWSNAITVGHGLSAAPNVMLCKKYLGNADQWTVFFSDYGSYSIGGSNAASNALRFDTDAAIYTNQSYKTFGGVMPTSTVFTVDGNNLNGSGDTIIAYCFANCEGYIKAGTYLGNANDDGTFVYTGFKPAFFMCKPLVTGNWRIQDNKRTPFNIADKTLFPNRSDAELSNDSNDIDIVSNGVKMRASDSDYNQATTFVYLAMAHNPFKYATAR
jgi:hypothetical protein